MPSFTTQFIYEKSEFEKGSWLPHVTMAESESETTFVWPLSQCNCRLMTVSRKLDPG